MSTLHVLTRCGTSDGFSPDGNGLPQTCSAARMSSTGCPLCSSRTEMVTRIVSMGEGAGLTLMILSRGAPPEEDDDLPGWGEG